MKYHLITYGCQMNTADSEEMARPLEAHGLSPTPELSQADVVLMNTCTVREHADHKALSNLGRLRKWKAENPNRIVIVAGCAASLWGEALKKKYSYVDLVSPATKIEQFPEAIARVLKERWNWDAEATLFEGGVEKGEGRNFMTVSPLTSHPSPFLFGSTATAYVTIMRGCNLNCAYCIVPQVRGREKYRPMPEILDEIRTKVTQGYSEVMLLGQTVNSYYWRRDSAIKQLGDTESPNPLIAQSRPYDFADLLGAVNAIDGVKQIRFMSPHPKHMRPRVIEAMRDSAKVARHIHLPLQSGSDTLLSRMKRLYTREEYIAIARALRAAMPGIAITTDVIVGFPGETTSDFDQTLALIDAVGFNGLFAFKYSPRPGTESAQEPDDVTESLKEERLQRILNAPRLATAAW